MKLYSKEELKYSRIFFDKQPSKVLYFICYFLLIILVLSIVGLKFIKKNYIVKAEGTIEASDKSYITPLNNGYIVKINKKDGDKVKKGDLLLQLSGNGDIVQEEELKNQLDKLTSKESLYKKYEKSLNEKANYLKNKGEEQEFYGKVAYYLDQIESENKQQDKYSKKSIEKESEITNLKIEIENLKELSNEQLAQEIDAKEAELKGMSQELEELKDTYGENTQSSSTYNQLISELGTSRAQTEEKLSEIQSQLNIKSAYNENLKLLASKDGYVHYLMPIKMGLGLQAFQYIAQIDNDKSSELIVESYISAQDISKIKKGNSVKISINGVNQMKFGMLDGTISKISNGTITQQINGNNQLFYQVIISLKDKQLKGSENENILAIASMPITANIVYEKETYWDWMLNQLNFKK